MTNEIKAYIEKSDHKGLTRMWAVECTIAELKEIFADSKALYDKWQQAHVAERITEIEEILKLRGGK
jgi:hypothetical protein